MDDFVRRDGRLFAEDVPVETIAQAVGTPAYVYSKRTLLGHFRRLRDAFAAVSPKIRYAVKANGNLALLRLLADEGAGFDVVSRGEIHRVLKAGGLANSIDFAGVGKKRDEIEYALEVGIDMFNVESEAELELIEQVARDTNQVARVALRVNPDVDPKTHKYISTGQKESKFGLDIDRAQRMAGWLQGRDAVRLTGLHAHIGSQITQVQPYVDAVTKLLALAKRVRELHPTLTSVNIGGGFGIHYRENEAQDLTAFSDALVPMLQESGFEVHMEPGRVLVGNAGLLVTKVIFEKRSGDKRFVICDAAMNDLIRPSLYGAFHRVEPVGNPPGDSSLADIVGPVCESGDFLAKDRELPPLAPGDLLAVRSAGAYAFVMASNYNARPRPVEVLVDGDRFGIVRARETEEELMRGESAQAQWCDA